jgi:hypothetical protein
MANYYLDFVGLNTFIYEPVGYDPDNQDATVSGMVFENGYEAYNYDNANVVRTVSQNFIGANYLLAQEDISLFRNKNYVFTSQNANLPTTASFFPALMLKRNGPYGYPTWKQIRLSENPLSRRQRKENIFTMVEEPGPEATFRRDGKIQTVKGKYGAILKYDEVPVTSRHKPFVVIGQAVTDDGELEKFQLKATYGNEATFFENDSLNKKLGLRVQKSQQYETVSGFYLNGGLDDDVSPIDVFESFTYREAVWPPRVYAYKNYVRQRTTFTFPWRDSREDRTEESDNGFGSDVTQSIWPLDVRTNWDTDAVTTDNRFVWEYGINTGLGSPHKDYGILQNSYNFARSTLPGSLGFGGVNYPLRVAPIHSRKHLTSLSSSVVSPNGMRIEGINTGSTMGDMDATTGIGVPGGEAKWEAGAQSGLNPFYDTYSNYIQGVKQYGKDYSIIPEFRISEHVEAYQSKGLSEEIDNLFSLTGALEDTADSSKSNFYKIYSTSDFMKHFEMIKEDHKDFVSANSITLKCKAVKKFLPYEGFYPAQRSVDLAKQFFDSYKEFTSVSGASDPYATVGESPGLFQNLMVPTFAPGIFYNSIKAGVACDYPLIDSNLSLAAGNVHKSGDDYYLESGDAIAQTKIFNRRIPFEAIVEPEKHLSNFRVYCNEPHLYANNSGSIIWDGNGNNLYKLMAQNFTAETSEFFLKGKSFTSISSKPSSDPNVGKAEAGKTYMMRVKMYKSAERGIVPIVSSSTNTYTSPQYDDGIDLQNPNLVNRGDVNHETFTMYSRPSAFGPPIAYPLQAFTSVFTGSAYGMNYSYTPPYYYGQAWCDITFTASQTKKYSIQEIIASSSIRQWRYANDKNVYHNLLTKHINGTKDDTEEGEYGDSMGLNSSVNIFSQTDFVAEQSARGTGLVLPNSSDNPSRWVIQTKFETPMLNFNHLSASSSITLPNNASQSVPRGMWHQYGLIEEDASKGIFLQVDSVPSEWIDYWLGGDSTVTGSLVDLCGFSTEAVKLGQIADEKKVYEAVVAVPFVEEGGERKFFRIPRQDIDNAQNPEKQSLVGDSVVNMVKTLKRYVMPPPMDFINNETIDPFAMYVFEFSHSFKKQDLADMWQNLYPQIGQSFETQTSTLSHELLAHELLGGGAKITPEGTLDVNAVGNEIPNRVRWMVFKIKQRAKINYYEKIIGRSDDLPEATVSSQGANVQVSYNWPYDFFSLVELAKLESEVKFAEREEKPAQEPRETVAPKVSNKVRRGIRPEQTIKQALKDFKGAKNNVGIKSSPKGRR